MNGLGYLKAALIGGASAIAFAGGASAAQFDIPRGDLASALDAYTRQSGVEIIYSDDEVRGRRSPGAKGNYSELAALTEVLRGTGFTTQTMPSKAIGIVPESKNAPVQLAQAARRAPAAPLAPAQAGVETVVVTAQKKSENIQNVPIAVTALSQAQLTERQIAGGPDLVKEVPNLTFSKTNFTGYNIQIRGIGTQAISVTTDPAVAVAFNGTPFIRNHFFEQEFYDLQDVEVLRGPQGTLYGRNATAGVVNLKSALPNDSYEAMLSADLGNFSNRRLEAMLNLPVVGDKLDIRFAGEWTKREGYTEDTTLNMHVDGRDLWSTRLSIGWKPAPDVQIYFVWEHFSEDDDRLRSGKQLCETDYGPGVIDGVPVPAEPSFYGVLGDYLTQGCKGNVSLYSPLAYGAPLGYALPYVLGLEDLGRAGPINPYTSVTQSTNLREIESSILPHYAAKNDTLEFNANWNISPNLTLTSQTGYNNDFLWSTEDFNRFGARPGLFEYTPGPSGSDRYGLHSDPSGLQICYGNYGGNGATCDGGVPVGSPCITTGLVAGTGCYLAGYYCDPQLGCSDKLIAEDLSTERAWQFSQEFRMSSNFKGPFNFTAGGNYLHYETVEKYYVFSNALTLITSNNPPPLGYAYNNPNLVLNPTNGYVDPNPLSNLNDEGHNYFLSNNPYVLNSYALFGDANYDLTNDLKFIAGLRWTDDQKHFMDIPSAVAAEGYGYAVTGIVDQSWQRFTGRAVVNWTPHFDFTDQTLIYGSYAHGYKAGGANPPGALFFAEASPNNGPGANFALNPVHPLTFKPEYIEAFELGSKNTLLDGALTLNGDVFYYNYTGYQVSEIVDRTAINSNYNSHVEGAELESNWEPAPGLKFGFSGGYENTSIAGGTEQVDLLDRTAGKPGWYVNKPFVTEASNCIFPAYVVLLSAGGAPSIGGTVPSYCSIAYELHDDPITGLPYTANPSASAYGASAPAGYPGFDPLAGTPGDPYTGQNIANGINYGPVPNNGQGFSKNLSGHALPNAPHFTASLTTEYTIPVSDDWAATLHTDFYWQSQQWARVFEDPIDKIHGYSNVNLSLIFTSANGWQVMGYIKNIFDTTTITGTFLNSDDTGLTTNVFLTDPRLYGIRVTKHLDEGDGFWGNEYSGANLIGLFSDAGNGRPALWLTLGGSLNELADDQQAFAPPFFSKFTAPLTAPIEFQHPPASSFDYDAKLVFEPVDGGWTYSLAVQYGRVSRHNHTHQQTVPASVVITVGTFVAVANPDPRYLDAFASSKETHAIFDFNVGKDVGLGMFGLAGSSDIAGGLRYVQFNQSSDFSIHADPDYVFNKFGPKYNDNYFAFSRAKRSFHGLGPSLAWNASTSVSGDLEAGGVHFDWGVNGALLIGRQIAHVHQQTSGIYRCRPALNGGCKKGVFSTTGSAYPQQYHSHYQRTPAPANRSRTVVVPNIGAFAGVSWQYRNAKISFGYRADEFFGAMDGGIDTRKSENVGFFGPYANISVGLGG